MPEEELATLLDFEAHSERLGPPLVAALRLARHMTDHPEREVDEALFEELRRHFDEGEILELAAMIGLFHYTNRFNNALGIEITQT
jgi:alkylhydroperoxidase family enzyme